MITEAELQSKTNDELLDLWKNQQDYRPEVVAWAKTEMERRGINPATVRVMSAEELKAEEAEASDFDSLRMLTFFQALFAALIFGVALTQFMREASGDRMTEEPDFRPILFTLPITILVVAYTIGIWKRQKWALVSGWVTYNALGIFCFIAVTIIVVANFFIGLHSIRLCIITAGAGAIFLGFGRACNRARKKILK